MTWNLEDSAVISFKLKDNYFLLSKNDYNTSLKNCLNSNIETNFDFDSTILLFSSEDSSTYS